MMRSSIVTLAILALFALTPAEASAEAVVLSHRTMFSVSTLSCSDETVIGRAVFHITRTENETLSRLTYGRVTAWGADSGDRYQLHLGFGIASPPVEWVSTYMERIVMISPAGGRLIGHAFSHFSWVNHELDQAVRIDWQRTRCIGVYDQVF